MAEVQAFMSARSAEIFHGQEIGVEAHIADSWGGIVTVPRFIDNGSTENAPKQSWHFPHKAPARRLCLRVLPTLVDRLEAIAVGIENVRGIVARIII